MLSRLLVVVSRICILAVLLIGQDAVPQQIELRTDVQTEFDQLESIEVPFDRASTPRQGQSCKHCLFVLLHGSRKGVKGFQMVGLHVFEPAVKLMSAALTYHVQKRFHQLVGRFSPWACLPEPLKVLPFFFLQVGLLTEKELGGLLHSEGQQRMGRSEKTAWLCVAADLRETLGKAEGSNVAQ
jgi:hypothetical protein